MRAALAHAQTLQDKLCTGYACVLAGEKLTGGPFGLAGDLALQPERPRRKGAVARLEQEGVEPPGPVNRPQGIHADPEADILLQGVAGQRDRLKIGAEGPLGLVVGVADVMANQKSLAREFATPRHGLSL